MSTKHITLSVLLTTLTACSAQYDSRAPLPQQLAGKSTEEKRTILRLACLNEAEKVEGKTYRMQYRARTTRPPHYSPWVRDMKSLCFQMSAEYASGNEEPGVALAKKCRTLITQGTNKETNNSRHHAENMQQICEAFTGTKVDD